MSRPVLTKHARPSASIFLSSHLKGRCNRLGVDNNARDSSGTGGYSRGVNACSTLPNMGAARQGGASTPASSGVRRLSLDRFDVHDEIYRGAISTVYHAVCLDSGEHVVLKAYHKELMETRHQLRLAREIEVHHVLETSIGSLVCRLIDSFEDTKNKYLVLERCAGGDVFQLQEDHGGRLNEAYVCTEIVVPLLEVLSVMHGHHWLHRDVKPENIFLTEAGGFKLGDFGLSINFERESPFHIAGTLDYLAPEMLRNPDFAHEEGAVTDEELDAGSVKPYGPGIDAWAVGIITYELVTGDAPFADRDEGQTMQGILKSTDIHFPGSMSPQWADFVRCALEKDETQRSDVELLLQHPWVRRHQSNKQRCGVAKVAADKSLLCRGEGHRTPRITSVERTGIRDTFVHLDRPESWLDNAVAKRFLHWGQDVILNRFAHNAIARRM